MTKVEFFLLGLVGIILGTTAEIAWHDSGRYVKYDCNLVGVSVDMPEQVKQQCREMRKK